MAKEIVVTKKSLDSPFIISVDSSKKRNHASYCLGTVLKSGSTEVILQKGFVFLGSSKKQAKKMKSFNKEVKRLAKYFDAKVIKEINSGGIKYG